MTSAQAVERRRGRQSWFRSARPVKRVPRSGYTERPGTGLLRHLEGWPLGVLSLGIACLAAAVGVPRPVVPDVVPVPEVDAAELGRAAAERLELTQGALNRPLSFEVRSLGEAIRRYGRATVNGNVRQAAEQRARLARLADNVRATQGDRPLFILRAVQTELFLAALLHWEASGRADDDLVELGGDFITKAQDSGWIRGRLLMSNEERAVLFGMRWTSLLELNGTRLGPTQNEWRLYYRFLLRHPEGTASPTATDFSECPPDKLGCWRSSRTQPAADIGGRPSRDRVSGSSAAQSQAEIVEQQLRVVKALTKRDPDYPGLLAKGVLMYRRGDLATAAEAFRSYLSSSPDGPWHLRARNYLRACVLDMPYPANAPLP
jgi:hypothetical protein